MTIGPMLVYRHEPAESKDMLESDLPVSRVCRHAPLLASQILTVLSSDVNASWVESCEKATELT